MVKRISRLCLFLFCLSLIPFQGVSAHTALEQATPEEGEQLKNPIKVIELSFSTNIENGSTLYLENKDGKRIEPSSVRLTNNNLKATFSKRLPANTYTVNWKILGADGHVIENKYSFTIVKDAASVKGEPSNPPSQEEINKSIDEQEETNETSPSDVANSSTSQSNTLMYSIVIGLILAGILLLVWMLFSKRSK